MTDLNSHYNSTGFNENNNHNRFKYNTNNNKKDIKNNTMSNGFGYTGMNNYNRKMGIQRPSTAPQKDKSATGGGNNKFNMNRNNQYGNNNVNKPIRYNQRPSSAGGKNKNGYSNNINRNGIGKNFSNTNMNKNGKKNMNIGINKRLASPQIYSNNNMGYNNPNNIRTKFNPAKHRMPSPVIKSNNYGKRPPLPNSGSRIPTNKSDKFN